MTNLYNRNFLLAMASQTLFVLANTLMAHFNRWIEFLGGDVRQVGWIMGAGPIIGLFLRPWIGQWINRLGARRTWFIGFCVFGVGALGNLALVELSWPIYLYRCLLVLGAALVFASGLTYATLVAPVERQTEAIGVLGAGGFVGMLFGPFLGDLILGSGERTRDDFMNLFLAATAALVAASILLVFVRTPGGSTGVSQTRLRDFVRTCRAHWPGTILLVSMTFGLCMAVPFGFLASYVDAYGLHMGSAPAISIFFWCYAGWGLAVRLSSSWVPDRLGRRKVLLLGLVLMGSGMFSYVLVSPSNPYWLILPALVCGTAHALTFHTMVSLSLEPFPRAVRGTGSTLSLMMQDMGMIAGAPILGQIAARAGFEAMFLTIGIACFTSGSIYALAAWRQTRGVRPSVEHAAPADAVSTPTPVTVSP